MTLINRGINYVTIWFSTLVTFIILGIRKIKPASALTHSLSVDSFRSSTPQEKFDELLDNEEYEEALKIAKRHNLNADPVYKKKWTKSRITTDTIRLLLTPIQDHSWVISQCLTGIANDIDSNRELLQFGQALVEELLDSTESKKNQDDGKSVQSGGESKTIHAVDEIVDGDEISDVSSNLSSESLINDGFEWQDLTKVDFNHMEEDVEVLFTYRYLFIKYLVRLKSFEKILSCNSRDPECIDQDHWKHFRNASCFEILLDLAHKSEWRSIKIILSRHVLDTKEHWLTILSNFPETLKPALYQDLLPCSDNESGEIYPSFKQQLKRDSSTHDEIEWCYQLRDILKLEQNQNQFIENFYEKNPFFSDFRRVKLDTSVVSSWFLIRAREIEVRSSLVSNAIELLELGIDRNIPDLYVFKDDLDTYATLVYQCFPMYNLDDIGFSEFERLSKEERVNLLMLGASDDEKRFSDCLHRFLLPYLHKISQDQKEEKELLWDFIVNSAKHKLNIVQKLFIDYKMSKELGSISGQEIIQSEEELVDYGIKCIYANERTDQLDAAFNIVETFPEPDSQFFLLDKERNDKTIRLYKRLEVAELLEQYNYYITVQRLEEMVNEKDKAGIKGILNKITRDFCRKVDSVTLKEQDWLQFLKDLERIRNSCFYGFFPLEDVYEVFIKGILTSGRLEHFRFISNFMQLDPNLPSNRLISYDKSVEIILDAAQHYVNSANSVTDEIIDTAKKCLAILGEAAASKVIGIKKEKDFIEALSILGKDFDFNILPIQIRLMEDSKIELIHQIISSSPKAYKKTNEFIKLSKILNIFGDESSDEANEVKLLTILGNYAYERQDYNHCWTLCKIIIDKNYTTGWRLCELLGNSSSFKNNYSRLKLLSFAVIHCDDDGLIFEILSNIKKLKLVLLEESMNCLKQQEQHELSGLPSTFSSISSTSSSLLSSLPTIEITSKLIKSMTRLAEQGNTESESNAIKQTPLNQSYNSININPFYYDAFPNNSHFNFNLNNFDYSYLGFGDLYSNQINLELSNHQIKLRTEMLKKDINWETVRSLCIKLSSYHQPVDTLLCISSILPLKGDNDELPFKKISPKSPALIFTALYFYSLVLYLKNLGLRGKDDWPNNIASEPMSSIITKADQICKESYSNEPDYPFKREKQLIEQYFEMYCNIIQSDTIASLDSSVDVERFACEIDYRYDTLLGLAMTTDEKIFNVVISLGKQYSVPLTDLYLTHLEFLLTDPTNDVELIANKVFKNDDFEAILKENANQLENYFEKRIFPLVSPDDHNRLVLCYQIIEKFCYPPVSSSSSDENVEPGDVEKI
ncbi:neuroblastoma-amplified sequence-like [Tetranychus urticae]|uniref:Sec39 domain-containing protein n=1 Tax=Tetranychus urticae TaxID=32264 RepID=T1KR96_TETUR|nr:neuroblastoma-amplified sequence-like [Tetranychus urticae]